MNNYHLIRKQEKESKIVRCLKCERVLTTMEENDIQVCDHCSRRKNNKQNRHRSNIKALFLVEKLSSRK
ncbi:hypothetical protein [Salinibacillus xinjiangensis]|uniref:Uncharacterized protein n=1 Tax=Salinibacillus xinjiangensis TaxID=1229268 RepID=A0A6G1X753_9BACI|nr:hypothetical protein [Salinibacillus xinjiangensis]MRG86759.1 hypothetical protein [Salinibacillus xinjiangensis]